MSSTVTLSRKNQIVIPKEARRVLHLQPGARLLVLSKPDRIVMLPEPDSYPERLKGLHGEIWEGLEPGAYVTTERKGWKK